MDPTTGTIVAGGTGAVMTRRVAPGETSGSFSTLIDDPSSIVSAWNPLTGDRVTTYVGPGLGVSGLAVSPDGKIVVATKGKGPGKGSYLLAWDAISGKLVGEVDYDRTTAYGVAFSEDGHKLAVAVGNEVRVISVSD